VVRSSPSSHLRTSAGNPSALLRAHAVLLQSPCVLLVQVRTQTHYRAAYLSWWHAIFKRIAPRTFTVSTHLSFCFPAYRRRSPFSVLRTFTVRTHLSFCRAAYRRSSPSPALRTHAALLFLLYVSAHLRHFCAYVPSGKDKFQAFKNNPDSQIYRSDQAPKRSQSISRFALFIFRSSSHKIFNPKHTLRQMISFALYRQALPHFMDQYHGPKP